MAITIPTVDEFTESTVMLVLREIAEYICGNNGLVAQINNNDITGFTSSYTNNVLKIDATKGDGSTIPVCNLTIQGGSGTSNPYPTAVSGTVGGDGNITFTITMSSGNPLTTTINMNYFASTADLSDLQEQVSGIKPVVTTNLETSPPTITVAVNGTSSTANLPDASGYKFEYPTETICIDIDSMVGYIFGIETEAIETEIKTSLYNNGLSTSVNYINNISCKKHDLSVIKIAQYRPNVSIIAGVYANKYYNSGSNMTGEINAYSKNFINEISEEKEYYIRIRNIFCTGGVEDGSTPITDIIIHYLSKTEFKVKVKNNIYTSSSGINLFLTFNTYCDYVGTTEPTW